MKRRSSIPNAKLRARLENPDAAPLSEYALKALLMVGNSRPLYVPKASTRRQMTTLENLGLVAYVDHPVEPGWTLSQKGQRLMDEHNEKRRNGGAK